MAAALCASGRMRVEKGQRRQVFEATMWSKVRSPAGAVLMELSDVGVMWGQWDPFVVDTVTISCANISLTVVRKHSLRHVWKNWASEHNVDELNEDVRFEPVTQEATCGFGWTKVTSGKSVVLSAQTYIVCMTVDNGEAFGGISPRRSGITSRSQKKARVRRCFGDVALVVSSGS